MILIPCSFLACATVGPPTARLASTEAAMRAAEEIGAASVPAAALHLQMARDQSAHAKALMKQEDNEKAALVLRCAQADAELALLLARAESAAAASRAASERAGGLWVSDGVSR